VLARGCSSSVTPTLAETSAFISRCESIAPSHVSLQAAQSRCLPFGTTPTPPIPCSLVTRVCRLRRARAHGIGAIGDLSARRA
jgi:hypothetical protein